MKQLKFTPEEKSRAELAAQALLRTLEEAHFQMEYDFRLGSSGGVETLDIRSATTGRLEWMVTPFLIDDGPRQFRRAWKVVQLLWVRKGGPGYVTYPKDSLEDALGAIAQAIAEGRFRTHLKALNEQVQPQRFYS